MIGGSLYRTGPVKDKSWESVIKDKTKINLPKSSTAKPGVALPSLDSEASTGKGNLMSPKLVSEAGKTGPAAAIFLSKDITSKG